MVTRQENDPLREQLPSVLRKKPFDAALENTHRRRPARDRHVQHVAEQDQRGRLRIGDLGKKILQRGRQSLQCRALVVRQRPARRIQVRQQTVYRSGVKIRKANVANARHAIPKCQRVLAPGLSSKARGSVVDNCQRHCKAAYAVFRVTSFRRSAAGYIPRTDHQSASASRHWRVAKPRSRERFRSAASCTRSAA